jgi:hypothetical protein
LGERELKLRRARRAAELDARRLPLQPTNRQAKVDAAISFAQLANNLEDADERLEMYEKSYALRDQVAREDPSDRFAAGVQRRAIVQVAEARLGAGDPAGARALALRSRAAMVASDSAGTLEEEAIWRARSYLVLATLDGRERRPEEGCRWLRQAEPEITAAEKFGHILPNTALPQAREALPGCR